MNVLVTGADGFVGAHLVPALAEGGHQVVASVVPGAVPDRISLLSPNARVVELDVTAFDQRQIRELGEIDAVIHLAAVSSGPAVAQDPGKAWEVNTGGTARLAEAFGARWGPEVLFLLISSGEVYGRGRETGPRREDDPTEPVSPYAATKLGAEIAVLEIHRRTGLRAVVARAFGHSGPGQTRQFVLPAFASRILQAKQRLDATVPVGDLTPVRDFLHVTDVVRAYMRLLECGQGGEIYNVASGVGLALRDLFVKMCDIVGHRVEPVVDPSLLRPTQIETLIGAPDKMATIGWRPRTTIHDLLVEIVNAQAN